MSKRGREGERRQAGKQRGSEGGGREGGREGRRGEGGREGKIGPHPPSFRNLFRPRSACSELIPCHVLGIERRKGWQRKRGGHGARECGKASRGMVAGKGASGREREGSCVRGTGGGREEATGPEGDGGADVPQVRQGARESTAGGAAGGGAGGGGVEREGVRDRDAVGAASTPCPLPPLPPSSLSLFASVCVRADTCLPVSHLSPPVPPSLPALVRSRRSASKARKSDRLHPPLPPPPRPAAFRPAAPPRASVTTAGGRRTCRGSSSSAATRQQRKRAWSATPSPTTTSSTAKVTRRFLPPFSPSRCPPCARAGGLEVFTQGQRCMGGGAAQRDCWRQGVAAAGARSSSRTGGATCALCAAAP